MRKEVPPHDAVVRCADHVTRLDELGAAKRLQVRADETRWIERREEADQEGLREHPRRDDPAVARELERRADPRAREDQEQEQREGHHRLGEPRDGRVRGSAEVAGCGADRQRDQQCDQRCAEPDLQRGAGGVEHADQLVPAERPVGAEDEQRRLRVWRRDQPAEVVDEHGLRHGHVRPGPGRT